MRQRKDRWLRLIWLTVCASISGVIVRHFHGGTAVLESAALAAMVTVRLLMGGPGQPG